ncbi:helix-turn-helix domain-containing protein [Mycobacterium sp. 21AC1]|uniref:PucR family transcriptional regulator n=1 Tax=[Mycobacterium] appelbergii TaxID=2939269 RepID=UPI0029390CBB|nr:helix-turn-helix domain-containing protein [Mycobacterium sp. 21AC1]MDV3128369.1 helix-turn-helix domain-containing protein [Mycobacterium sp. 21AC1]
MVVREGRSLVPAYDTVPTGALIRGVRRNRELAGRVLLTGVVPNIEDITEADLMTAERLHQGVEIQDVMAGFRVVIGAVRRWLIDNASGFGVDSDEALQVAQTLWGLSDAFLARAAMTFRRESIAQALADEQMRAQWALELLAGTLDSRRIDHGCDLYGLDRDALYHPFCTPTLPHDQGWRVRQELGRTSSTQAGSESQAIVAPDGGRLVGVMAAPPTHCTALVGLGPPVRLEAMATAYVVAQQVLAAATLSADHGINTVDTMSWRLAVPAHEEVSRLLLARYVDPLKTQGGFGQVVLEAVDAWLDNGRSIPQTAAKIHVHVNTLRYRLARYESLVGRTLDDTETLIELSWALLARRATSNP